LVVLVACCAAVVGLAAGCGGGSSSSVPKGDVALVDGQPITQARFDTLLAQYFASLKAAKQAVPKKGSDGYKSVAQRLVAYLVSRAELEQQAKKLGVTVTPKDIDAGVKKFVDQYFAGSQKKFVAAMKAQHATIQQVRDNVAFTALQTKLVAKVTIGVKISDQDALAYYNKNVAQYVKAASRDLEHILVKKKKLADSIHTQLQNGASFAALAKKYSIDTGSKTKGGKLGVLYKNQLVAPFANAAFALNTGEISKPVQSQFGWHVIKALGPVLPASKSPFSKEKAKIKQQLAQAKKNVVMAAWQTKFEKFYATRVEYASAYAPPSTATAPGATSLLPTSTVPTG
jgi:parvulin-like peptidyl-prolyl isomerase